MPGRGERPETGAEEFARATDPEGFNRRGLLEKAPAAIQKSGRALMEEMSKLIPARIAKAGEHDVNAANQAERLADTERVRAQAESGNGTGHLPRQETGLVFRSAPRSPPAPSGSSAHPSQ